MKMSQRKLIEIVSDVMCPWCWIGKRNLEKALEIAGLSESDVEIVWKPLMLRPGIPEEGQLKTPDTPQNPRVGRRLREAGQGAGAGNDFTGKCDRTPNTLKAHALLKFALEQQQVQGDKTLQNRISETLFRRYFTDGEFVDSEDILAEAISEVGIDRTTALSYINNEDILREVRMEVTNNAKLVITGVPTFFFDGVPAFSGAQQPERFLQYLK